MSYARLSEDSDVYVYKANDGVNTIWRTHLKGDETVGTDLTLGGLKTRLQGIQASGKRVPKETLERIDRELAMQSQRDGDELP